MDQKTDMDGTQALNETQLVTFVLAGEEFGLPINVVKEIVRVPEVTRIPRTPAFVEGVANLRGNILPILNLRQRFDLPAEERTDDNRAVVIEVSGRLTGLLVDRVSEVIRVPNGSIEPPPPVIASTVDSAYLHGVAKLAEGKRLVLLLDIERVMPSAEVAAAVKQAAQAGAAGQATETLQRQAQAEEQLVSFRLAGEEYAVEIMNVQEIIRVAEIARVPKTPDFVEGVVTLRNRLLPIVNLRKRFGLPAVELDDDSRVIVINLGGAITGLQVDAVSEVLRVPKDSVEAPPRILSASEADHLRGVAKLDSGKRLIMLLNVNRLLSADELGQLQTLAGEAQPAQAGVEAGRQALDEEQFVGFRVENEEFGVNIQQVQEIIWLPEITKVPRAPTYVEGIVNLRGSVLPVLDIRKRFGLAVTAATDSTSIVVVDIDGHKTGVIVDSVSEVLRFSRDAIEPPPPIVKGVDASFVKGVGKLEGGQRMLIILELSRVLLMEGAAASVVA